MKVCKWCNGTGRKIDKVSKPTGIQIFRHSPSPSMKVENCRKCNGTGRK